MTGDGNDSERRASEEDNENGAGPIEHDEDEAGPIEHDEARGILVGHEEDFAVGTSHTFDVDGQSIAVIRTENGFYAVRNECPHQGGPVGEGRVSCSFHLGEGGTGVSDLEVDPDRLVISCPWHGWPFDLETGVHVTEPEYGIPTYDVRVEDGSVYLEL